MGAPVAEFDENDGPCMAALTELERNLVRAFFDHPNYTQAQLAEVAGYQKGTAPNQLSVAGARAFGRERVIAAMQEEGSKRLRSGGALAVSALMDMVRNPQHKDHAKAVQMALDRTGFHAMSEHKVIVDDKRPQTKAELIAAITRLAAERGLDTTATMKLIGRDPSSGREHDPTKAIDAEFEVIEDEKIEVEDL